MINVWKHPDDGAGRGRNLPILLIYYSIVIDRSRIECGVVRTPSEMAKLVLRRNTKRDTLKFWPEIAYTRMETKPMCRP